MASKTDIANIAVALHSGQWVSNVDSAPGKTADALRALWIPTYEFALSLHPWKWCKWSWRDQKALPATQNPDPELRYAFQKPADCVRVFRIAGDYDFDEWRGLITTNQDCVTMIGTQRGVDTGYQAASFNELFGAMLGLRICTPINASEAIRKRCTDEVARALELARQDNGKVGIVRRPIADSFVLSRLSGGPPFIGG